MLYHKAIKELSVISSMTWERARRWFLVPGMSGILERRPVYQGDFSLMNLQLTGLDTLGSEKMKLNENLLAHFIETALCQCHSVI